MGDKSVRPGVVTAIHMMDADRKARNPKSDSGKGFGEAKGGKKVGAVKANKVGGAARSKAGRSKLDRPKQGAARSASKGKK